MIHSGRLCTQTPPFFFLSPSLLAGSSVKHRFWQEDQSIISSWRLQTQGEMLEIDGQLPLFPRRSILFIQGAWICQQENIFSLFFQRPAFFSSFFFSSSALPQRLLRSMFLLFHTTIDLLRLAKSIATLVQPKLLRLSCGHVSSPASKAQPEHYAMLQVRVTWWKSKNKDENIFKKKNTMKHENREGWSFWLW